jgi:ABC-type multidrug transport system permease subunit
MRNCLLLPSAFQLLPSGVYTLCMELESSAQSDAWFYVLAALCGVGTGIADVIINDLLLTALLVVASCLLLGILRPRWPWRWVLVVGVFIPLTELAAFVVRSLKPTRAQIYASFLAFLPGFAGAYGGSIMRRVFDNLQEGR